jgi:hypothetical protein
MATEHQKFPLHLVSDGSELACWRIEEEIGLEEDRGQGWAADWDEISPPHPHTGLTHYKKKDWRGELGSHMGVIDDYNTMNFKLLHNIIASLDFSNITL